MTEASPYRLVGVVALAGFVVGIISVAFRGSWGAFRDAALACHFDADSAALYPFAVDGLMVVAIIALVLLRHNQGARTYCLWIVGAYTAASLLINYLHGIGMFSPDPLTGQRPVPPWGVVLVVALLVVGSIFLGSHLLVHVWRHTFPEDPATVAEVADDGEPVALTVPEAVARLVDGGMSQRQLADALGSRDKIRAAYRQARPLAKDAADLRAIEDVENA